MIISRKSTTPRRERSVSPIRAGAFPKIHFKHNLLSTFHIYENATLGGNKNNISTWRKKDISTYSQIVEMRETRSHKIETQDHIQVLQNRIRYLHDEEKRAERRIVLSNKIAHNILKKREQIKDEQDLIWKTKKIQQREEEENRIKFAKDKQKREQLKYDNKLKLYQFKKTDYLERKTDAIKNKQKIVELKREFRLKGIQKRAELENSRLRSISPKNIPTSITPMCLGSTKDYDSRICSETQHIQYNLKTIQQLEEYEEGLLKHISEQFDNQKEAFETLDMITRQTPCMKYKSPRPAAHWRAYSSNSNSMNTSTSLCDRDRDRDREREQPEVEASNSLGGSRGQQRYTPNNRNMYNKYPVFGGSAQTEDQRGKEGRTQIVRNRPQSLTRGRIALNRGTQPRSIKLKESIGGHGRPAPTPQRLRGGCITPMRAGVLHLGKAPQDIRLNSELPVPREISSKSPGNSRPPLPLPQWIASNNVPLLILPLDKGEGHRVGREGSHTPPQPTPNVPSREVRQLRSMDATSNRYQVENKYSSNKYSNKSNTNKYNTNKSPHSPHSPNEPLKNIEVKYNLEGRFPRGCGGRENSHSITPTPPLSVDHERPRAPTGYRRKQEHSTGENTYICGRKKEERENPPEYPRIVNGEAYDADMEDVEELRGVKNSTYHRHPPSPSKGEVDRDRDYRDRDYRDRDYRDRDYRDRDYRDYRDSTTTTHPHSHPHPHPQSKSPNRNSRESESVVCGETSHNSQNSPHKSPSHTSTNSSSSSCNISNCSNNSASSTKELKYVPLYFPPEQIFPSTGGGLRPNRNQEIKIMDVESTPHESREKIPTINPPPSLSPQRVKLIKETIDGVDTTIVELIQPLGNSGDTLPEGENNLGEELNSDINSPKDTTLDASPQTFDSQAHPSNWAPLLHNQNTQHNNIQSEILCDNPISILHPQLLNPNPITLENILHINQLYDNIQIADGK